MNFLSRNTWVEIDLDRLGRNIAALREYVGQGVRIAPVIKGDAYGHGAVVIARVLERMDVEYIAVAILTEAIELRNHGIRCPLLVMGYTENEHLRWAVENDITLSIFQYEQAEILSREAAALHKTAHAHIKVDTGLHRLGKEPTEDFADEIAGMSRLPHLSLDGIFSHLRLASSEGDHEQFESLSAFINRLKEKGVQFRLAHISDSIAAVKYREFAMDMIRPGAIIYGYTPPYQAGRIAVEPIMTFKTRVVCLHHLKEGDGVGYDEEFKAGDNMVVATLAAGYADGYTRFLSRGGEVMIRGKRAKVVGIVCMDQMMVDVTHIPETCAGDEAVLWGPVPGAPGVLEMAALLKTNKNCIIAGVSRRVPRVYIKGGAVVEIADYLTNR